MNWSHMMTVSTRRPHIVGLGSNFGDDRLGWWAVDRLRALLGTRFAASIEFANVSTPVDLFHVIERSQELIVVDACQGLGSEGDFFQLKWPAPEIANLRPLFGHQVTLNDVFDLAAKLGQLPAICELWCVEGSRFEFGQPLSAAIETAGKRLVDAIVTRLNSVATHA